MAELFNPSSAPAMPGMFTPDDSQFLISLDDAFPHAVDEQSLSMPAPRPRHPAVLQLTPNEETRLLAQLRKHYDEASVGREENQTRRALRYRRYLGDVSLRNGLQPWKNAPQLFMPLTRKTVEDLVGYFSKVLRNPEAIELAGIGEEDVTLAWRRQAFYRWQLDQAKFGEALKEVLMDAALDSLGVLKVYRYSTPYPLPPGLDMLQTTVQYESVDLGTLLIPPDARGLQYPEARYLGHQLFLVPEDEFPAMRQRGHVLPMLTADGLPVSGYLPDPREEIEFTRESIHPEAYYEGTIEQVEAYEVFTMDSDDREFLVVHWFPKLLSQAGGAPAPHISRVTRLADALPQTVFPRPMWPFFDVSLWKQPRQLRGLNVPARLETYQDALNRLAEQMLHLGDITILPLVFANIALTGDVPDLSTLHPGSVVPLDNLGPNGMQIHQPSSHNLHFIEEMQIFRSAPEEDTNVTALSQGRTASQPNAPRTLGGLSLLLQQGNEARSQQVEDLALLLADPLKFGYALWQAAPIDGLTFVAPRMAQIEERLFGGSGQKLPIELITMQQGDLSGIFDLRISIDPDSHLSMQKYLTMAERLDAVLAPIWPEGRRLLWREVWKKMGLQSFDQFFPESVAKQLTMLQTLSLQVQLVQFEMMLMQMGQPGAEALAEAQTMAGGTPPPPPTAPVPLSSPSQGAPPLDFQSIIASLRDAAGMGGGEALAQAGVPETPRNMWSTG